MRVLIERLLCHPLKLMLYFFLRKIGTEICLGRNVLLVNLEKFDAGEGILSYGRRSFIIYVAFIRVPF